MDNGILFVDDEENILTSLARELRPWFKARNLQFWPVKSADEALAFLAKFHHGVVAVVTDMRMPAMAGDALVVRIRSSWPEIQTLILSGQAELAGLSRAVAAGIGGFLVKPWETEGLVGALDKAVAEHERCRLAALERTHLTYQLTRTREVQTTLFRCDELPPDRFGLELTYRPLQEQICGGDFYEIFQLGPDRCAVVVGDVSGHGAEAAFITGVLHTLICRDDVTWFLTGAPSPRAFLEHLNTLVFSHLSADQARNVVLTALVFDRADESLTFANAGGLPLIRVRAGLGTAYHLQGFPLGLAEGAPYPSRTLRTRAGDRWMVMTDGLVDRGRAGFIPSEDVVRLAAESVLSGRGNTGLLEDVLGLFPGHGFLDDLTLATVEVR